MPIQVEVGSVEEYLSWISSLAIFSFFSYNNSLLRNKNKES